MADHFEARVEDADGLAGPPIPDGEYESFETAVRECDTGNEGQLTTGNHGTAGAERAARIRRIGKELDYEDEALEGLARSWEVTDSACQALALQDALAFGLLHLSRVIRDVAQAAAAVVREDEDPDPAGCCAKDGIDCVSCMTGRCTECSECVHYDDSARDNEEDDDDWDEFWPR